MVACLVYFDDFEESASWFSSGDAIGCRCTVVVDVGTWAGASAGWLSEGSVTAVCAMVCCDREVSSDDIIETVFARSNRSRNRYMNKLDKYISR